jgi:starch synthase
MKTIQVLAVTPEIFPLVKTGGLADVTGALPGALADHGVAVRTLIPGYPKVMEAIPAGEVVYHFPDLYGGAARLIAATTAGLDLLVLEAPHLFSRAGSLYLGPDGKDWFDNATRFAALACVAAEVGRGVLAGYQPDIVHAHDWQAALAPVFLRFGGHAVKTVVTVHNMAFQGQFPADNFPLLGLPPEAFSLHGVEYYGGVGYLKGGLACADAITTVSPTYAEEICTSAFGMGLHGLLHARHAHLHGIVNGIDTAVWNPATDEALAQTYDIRSLGRRTANKRAIEQRFNLAEDDGLLYCVVSRLTWQKGLDILAANLDTLVASGARLALLGSGDAALEQQFIDASLRYPGRVGVIVGYDEPLSHLLMSGADAILVPSRFEPCGLTQLYGLRYGCVPVVARTGGLADTIVDANEAALSAGAATGVMCQPADHAALNAALERTQRLYADRKLWAAMQRAGMKTDVSWDHSAARYATLYIDLLKE